MHRNDSEYDVYYGQYKCLERKSHYNPCMPKPCHCCCPGPTGPAGPQGPQGPRGLQGATGATGPVGTILGSYDTLQALLAAHPRGNQGDAYLVGGALYIWNTGSGQWENVGNLQGPTGPQGEQGEAAVISGYYDDYDEFMEEHEVGTPGEMYIVEGNLYTWDEAAGQWRLLGSLMGPTGPDCVKLIP